MYGTVNILIFHAENLILVWYPRTNDDECDRYIWAIPYVAHLTKEVSFMAVAPAMSIRLLISLIPEKLLNIIDM